MRLIYALFFFTFSAFAQTPLTTEFLTDSTIPTDDALRAHVTGKTFKVKPAQGASWRLEYKDNGYAFVDITSGFRDSGKWKAEKGQLCNEWQKIPGSCSDVRLKDGVLYLKRVSNGEIVAFQVD